MGNKIVVYSKSHCSYCEMLKGYLKNRNIIFREIDVADPIRLAELKALLPGVKTVPQMFINDYHVGGARESIDFLTKLDLHDVKDETEVA